MLPNLEQESGINWYPDILACIVIAGLCLLNYWFIKKKSEITIVRSWNYRKRKELINLLLDKDEAIAIFAADGMVIEFANDKMLGYWKRGTGIIGQPAGIALQHLKEQPFITPVLETPPGADQLLFFTVKDDNGIEETFCNSFTIKYSGDNGATPQFIKQTIRPAGHYIAQTENSFRKEIEDIKSKLILLADDLERYENHPDQLISKLHDLVNQMERRLAMDGSN